MALGSFLLAHWMLSALFVAGLLGLLWNEWVHRLPKDVRALEAGQVVLAINHEKAQVFDMRDAAHFQQGHIVGALSVPFAQIEAQKTLWERHKNNPCIIVGETGQESLKAVRAVRDLQKEGTSNFQLAILAGGMRAWREAQLPLIRL